MENPTSDSDSWPSITYSKVSSKVRKALKLKKLFFEKIPVLPLRDGGVTF
jgi:hypothetical protein